MQSLRVEEGKPSRYVFIRRSGDSAHGMKASESASLRYEEGCGGECFDKILDKASLHKAGTASRRAFSRKRRRIAE